jgi:hypothetical protein
MTILPLMNFGVGCIEANLISQNNASIFSSKKVNLKPKTHQKIDDAVWYLMQHLPYSTRPQIHDINEYKSIHWTKYRNVLWWTSWYYWFGTIYLHIFLHILDETWKLSKKITNFIYLRGEEYKASGAGICNVLFLKQSILWYPWRSEEYYDLSWKPALEKLGMQQETTVC